MDSILTSVKKQLGIVEEDINFDVDIIIHINSVFSILTQLGVGPSNGYRIAGSGETWADFLGDSATLEMVKTYMYVKVRLIFDPPISSSVKEALDNMAKELEFRINVAVDPSATDR